MKKVLKIAGLFLFVVILALALIPVLFKDKLKQLILNEFARQTTATLYYGDIDLSAFRSFPDLDLGIDEFGIVGTGLFEGDTIVSASYFHASIDIKGLLFKSEVNIKEILFQEPSITLITLIGGEVNYDIMRPIEDVADEKEEDSDEIDVSLALQQIEVIGGQVTYFDQSMNMMLSLEEIDLKNKAFFQNDIFDLETTGSIGDVELIYEDIYFVSQKSIGIDATIAADMANGRYTFKENEFLINTLPFNLDGTFDMLPDGSYGMDIAFDSPKGTLKDVFSLVPGIYSESFDKLQADGEVTFKGTITGKYAEQEMPSFEGLVKLAKGSFTYDGVPAAIKDLNMELKLTSEKGELSKSEMELSKLDFRLADNQFSAQMKVMNFESPEWQLEAVGSLDLTSLSDLLPSAYQVKGLLTTKLSSSGNMKALEAEKYTDLPLEGTLTMDNFELVTEEFPHEFSIQTLNAEFSTERVLLKQMQGKIGSTSFQMSGTLQDFVPYALMDEKLTGTLQVAADQLIMNEWMTEDTLEDETKAPVDSIPESLQVVRIPTNIDFTMEAELGQLDYDGLLLNELQGSLQVVDGQLLINRSGFKTADGSFNATGKYVSRPPKPIFEMDLRVNSVSIPKSFDQFVAVQKFAPVAKNMSGNLGFNFTLSGLLGEDMMPDYSSLTGSGLIQVIKAGFERSELTQGLSSTLKVARIDNPVIDKLKMQADILDGRLFVKPFDTQFGNYNTTIGGSTGIDGTIDYTLLITVPAKGVTQQVNNLAKQYLGGQMIIGNEYVFDVSMTGTYEKPKFKLEQVMTKDGTTTEQLVSKKIEEEIQAKKEELAAVAREELTKAEDSLKRVVDQKLAQGEAKLDSLIANETDSIANELLEKLGGKAAKDSTVADVKDKAKDVLKGLLKRKNKKKNDTIKN